MREIHFYTRYQLAAEAGVELADMLLIGWDSAEEAIRRRKNLKKIHTLQMGLLDDAWEKHCCFGDRVFIHDGAGVFELAEDCARTNRKLKPTHDVYRLWRGGEFTFRGEAAEHEQI